MINVSLLHSRRVVLLLLVLAVLLTVALIALHAGLTMPLHHLADDPGIIIRHG